MYFVIQCASSKDESAPPLRTREGREVVFVAHPEHAPSTPDVLWSHPDAPSDTPRATWRQLLERNAAALNPLGLRRACDLYTPREYGMLAKTFGIGRVYILSAGWGLVRGDFPLPPYDITFVRSADPYKRRSPRDAFSDFVQLEVPSGSDVIFFGGKDYLPLFSELTRGLSVQKIIPFRCAPDDVSAVARKQDGFTWIPFRTTRCTNWHYSCVADTCSDPSWIPP